VYRKRSPFVPAVSSCNALFHLNCAMWVRSKPVYALCVRSAKPIERASLHQLISYND
jgi:hypothetical protein